MKTVEGNVLHIGSYAPGKTVKVQEQVRHSSYGDPNGHPVPVEGVSIQTKKGDVVTADLFLPYAGLSEKEEERKAQIEQNVAELTSVTVPEEKPTTVKHFGDEGYVSGRDGHEGHLY